MAQGEPSQTTNQPVPKTFSHPHHHHRQKIVQSIIDHSVDIALCSLLPKHLGRSPISSLQRFSLSSRIVVAHDVAIPVLHPISIVFLHLSSPSLCGSLSCGRNISSVSSGALHDAFHFKDGRFGPCSAVADGVNALRCHLS
jgi:hypothetical protein